MKKTSEYLIAAKQLISTPFNWCKHALRNHDAYCVVGAMRQVEIGNAYSVHDKYEDAESVKIFCEANGFAGANVVGHWNDREERTHSSVMQALDKAIAYAQVREELMVADAKPICREVDSQLNTGCESAEEVV